MNDFTDYTTEELLQEFIDLEDEYNNSSLLVVNDIVRSMCEVSRELGARNIYTKPEEKLAWDKIDQLLPQLRQSFREGRYALVYQDAMMIAAHSRLFLTGQWQRKQSHEHVETLARIFGELETKFVRHNLRDDRIKNGRM